MSDEPTKKPVTALRLIVGSIVLIVVMIAYGLLYTGRVRAVEIISASMEPTVLKGDRIFVWKYSDQTLKRGELVVMISPDDDGPELVKRIVGMPGDRLRMRSGTLFINDEISRRADGGAFFHGNVNDFDLVVPEDHFFVLGDNRSRSHDSTEFGPVSRNLITGLASYRYAPWERRGSLK